MCGATRLLVPAALVGVAVSSVSGHDAYGLVAAVLTAALLVVVARVRGTASTCKVARSPAERRIDADQVNEDESRITSP